MSKLKTIIPVAAAAAVIGSVAYSLSGYELPVFSAADFAVETSANGDNSSPLTSPLLAGSKELPDKESADSRVASAGAAALSTLGASLDSATYKDGTYRGTGSGFNGPIVVDVTVADGKITNISVVSSSDDVEYFNKAKSLLNNIIASQSTSVDTVSGATYSSVGLINACINALSKAAVTPAAAPVLSASVTGNTNSAATSAGGKKSSSAANVPVATVSDAVISGSEKGKYPYPDGTYTGKAMGFADEITVAVTLKNGYITSIKIVSHDDDDSFITSASQVMTTMVDTQNTNVDAVSGATFSSNGIIAAVQNALNAAKNASDNTKIDTSRIAGSTETSTSTGTKNTDSSVISGGSSTGTPNINLPVGVIDTIVRNPDNNNNNNNNSGGSVVAIIPGTNPSTPTNTTPSTETPTTPAPTESTWPTTQPTTQQPTTTPPAETTAPTQPSSSGTDTPATQAPTEPPTQAPTEPATEAPTEPVVTEPVNVYRNGVYNIGVYCNKDDYDDNFDEYILYMDITLINDRIVAIENITGTGPKYNNRYISKASEYLVPKIVESGNANNVDTVSGATFSSYSIIEACREVFNLAK